MKSKSFQVLPFEKTYYVKSNAINAFGYEQAKSVAILVDNECGHVCGIIFEEAAGHGAGFITLEGDDYWNFVHCYSDIFYSSLEVEKFTMEEEAQIDKWEKEHQEKIAAKKKKKKKSKDLTGKKS